MHTAVFSIVSPNYRHYARVLMDSMQRNHPDWDRFVLFVGDPSVQGSDGEPFTSVPLDALPLPNPRQFCFRYTIVELNTAVKPWMFEHLFARGYDRVIYFDPDIVIYSPLAELDAAPPQTFITLTPHLTGSIEGDEHPSERTILQAGTYNLGFLVVTRQPALSRFLAWWKGRLEFQCLVDPARGLFVDQKWMDLAPGLFPDVSILRHDGYNVAYWNLRQRSVVMTNGATTVNDQTLRFFHFSGFDATLPERVSRHDGKLRLVQVGHARKLIEDYRAALHAAGSASFKNARYGFAVFADGTRVPDAARAAYRKSNELQAAAGSDPFARPELFRELRDPLAKRMNKRALRMLLRVKPLAQWLPRPVRGALRDFMVGRREATSEER